MCNYYLPMKILILFLSLVSFNSFAVDVTTLSVSKTMANEMVLVSTDENFLMTIEKHFVARICKLRIGTNSIVAIKEISFPVVCRAEIIQFLLNNGHKADPYFLTFTK